MLQKQLYMPPPTSSPADLDSLAGMDAPHTARTCTSSLHHTHPRSAQSIPALACSRTGVGTKTPTRGLPTQSRHNMTCRAAVARPVYAARRPCPRGLSTYNKVSLRPAMSGAPLPMHGRCKSGAPADHPVRDWMPSASCHRPRAPQNRASAGCIKSTTLIATRRT